MKFTFKYVFILVDLISRVTVWKKKWLKMKHCYKILLRYGKDLFFISGSNKLRYGPRIPFTTKIGKNQDCMHIKFSIFWHSYQKYMRCKSFERKGKKVSFSFYEIKLINNHNMLWKFWSFGILDNFCHRYYEKKYF